MKIKLHTLLIPLSTLAILGLMSLISHSAKACESGNPRSNDYIRRDNNRCEGIRLWNRSSGSIRLISLTSRHQGAFCSILPIYVPKVSGAIPNVQIRALDFGYQLDQMQFQSGQTRYEFNLPTTVLTRTAIPLEDLRALAVMDPDDNIVYVPVMIQDSSDAYQFVFYSNHLVKFIEANISPLGGGQAIVSWGEQNEIRGEKVFGWADPVSAPAGRYEFFYSADIFQRDRPPERLNRRIVFEHNPDWLK